MAGGCHCEGRKSLIIYSLVKACTEIKNESHFCKYIHFQTCVSIMNSIANRMRVEFFIWAN